MKTMKKAMGKNLEQLDKLSKDNSFGSAHNAITCAVIYRDAYSEYLHKYDRIKDVLVAIKGVLSSDLNKLIDDKLKESNINL